MNTLQKIGYQNLPTVKATTFKAGDTVKVHCRIIEGEKERIQVFEGVVIRIHNNGLSSTFTARKVSYGIGVERIFPYYSPTIEKIETMARGRVRRAKLYYLRELKGKKARITEEQRKVLAPKAAAPVAEAAAPTV